MVERKREKKTYILVAEILFNSWRNKENLSVAIGDETEAREIIDGVNKFIVK